MLYFCMSYEDYYYPNNSFDIESEFNDVTMAIQGVETYHTATMIKATMTKTTMTKTTVIKLFESLYNRG